MVVEHLEQSKSSEQEQIPGFNPDLTSRLTRIHNDDTDSDMYRLRIYHPTNEKIITIYFKISDPMVSYYTFSEHTS
jgi:hypothetical protein